jgi:hypothetical protein
MTREELEKEKCELLGIIQGKDKVIADLEEENRQLKNEVEDLTAYCNQIGKIKTGVLKLFESVVAR